MPAIAWDALSNDMIDELFAAEMEELHLADRYEIHRVLGQGGQGTVYLAKDEHVAREVAIKCAHEQTVAGEATLLGSLTHPGIPQIYDRGVAIDGTHYLVMQYMAGQRLDHYLQHVQPNLEQRIALFKDIAGAVAHAHEQGILHRDLKPSNIIVGAQGRASIIDWGLAATGDPRAVCGSPHFAAPEQLDGQPADQRADIFALGVLLYFIISGELPYARRVTDFNEFRAVRAGLRRVPLRQVCEQAPRYLGSISQRAMAAQVGARFQRIDEMIKALNAHSFELQQFQRSTASKLLVPLLMMCLLIVAFLAGMYVGPQSAAGNFENNPANKNPEIDKNDEFVGPPSPDEINWNAIDWEHPANDADDAKDESEKKAPDPKVEEPLRMDPKALPSLDDILGEPEVFDPDDGEE